jgi:protein SYS1
VLLVSRSKQVPDFALTIHLFHLIVTSFYAKALPSNFLWWGLQAASAFLMVSFGVWASRYRELQPFSIGMGGTKDTQASANGSAGGDIHVRGSQGRGRQTDNGPAYEMMQMREGDDNV